MSSEHGRGVVTSIGGRSLEFGPSDGREHPTPAEGDLVSYDEVHQPDGPDTADGVRSLRRRTADGGRSARGPQPPAA